LYYGYITVIEDIEKHGNADRLQIVKLFDTQAIVDLSFKKGDIVFYIPSDMQISENFAERNNLLRKKDADGKEIGGYIDPIKRNIKAIKLKGENSDGIILPIACLYPYVKSPSDLKVGDNIDILDGEQIVKKYIPKQNKKRVRTPPRAETKESSYPLFRRHKYTPEIAYNLHQFNVGDEIIITEKIEGTSARTSNTLIRTEHKGLLRKIFGLKPRITKKYETISGNRKAILDASRYDLNKDYFGTAAFRYRWNDFFKNKLYKGETCYYEIVGWVNVDMPIAPVHENHNVKDKEFIKKYGEKTVFSYGNEVGENSIFVYRMTLETEDGLLIEYSYDLMKYRCEQMQCPVVPLLDRFYFTRKEDFTDRIHKHESGSSTVDPTHMREGIVISKNNTTNCTFFKKKCIEYKILESVQKDSGIISIEEAIT